jgi:hypothetical protein
MPRPKIDEDTYERLSELVDSRTKVPAKHLTGDEKLGFLLDALDEAERHVERLSARVDTLEDELEAARAEAADDDPGRPDADAIANADLPEELARNLGGNTRRR